MKNQLVILFITFFTFNSLGQGCGLISGTKNKKTGIETKGGIVNSKDFYSLLIQKQIGTKDSLCYKLFLNAASRVFLSDSLINSKGKFELFLTNGEKIEIENAECQNDPLKMGASIGFTVWTTENMLLKLIEYPIQKLKVFGILETEFAPKKLKQQQKIISCLSAET